VKKGAIYTIGGLLLLGLISFGLWKIYVQPVRVTQENLPKTTKDYILEAFSNKYSRAKEDFKIEVLTEMGNFAKGTVNINNEHSGGLWFAVKRSGGWNIVYEGNGIMPCDIADGNNLPVEIIPGCVDTQQGNSFVQRH
jgi:hypothetical protein